VACCGALAFAAPPGRAAEAPEDVTAASTDAAQVIEHHLAVGKRLLDEGDPSAAQAEFRAILRLDATHRDALRLMTQAQLQLDAAQQAQQRKRQQLREQAMDLAEAFAREKAAAHTRQAVRAERQVSSAREQQLKYLYNRGLRFYRQGAYQDAIDSLQQMVLLDPAHPLIHAAQQVITRAETKQAELRARASLRRAPRQGPAAVAELERQLTAKRMELETTLKYAGIALRDRHYDMAIELSQRVLAEDPTERKAQQLLEQAQTAKLGEERERLERLVERDERAMINEVVRAQAMPEPRELLTGAPAAAAAPDRGLTERLQQPITFDFQQVPLSDVLQFVADAANISIVPSPQLDLKAHPVTLRVQQMPLEQALKYLAKAQSLAYRVEQDAILIATPEEFSNAPMETRVFFLRSGLGPFALEAAAVPSNSAVTMDSIKQLIEQSVPQPSGSKLVMDERSGALVATNTAENLGLIEALLRQLDTTPLQVLIEARFVELTLTEFEQGGVEAVLTGPLDVTKRAASDGTQGSGHQIASGGGFKFPALTRESEGANITLQGVLTGTQFEAVLHALEESQKSKTLSAPRVTTLNNQTALIRVVDEFRYPTRYEVSLIQFDINGDGDFDDAGETEFANVPQDFQKRDVGILLGVTPSVGKDQKTITLILAPEVSAFSQFRDLEGGVVVPEFTTSQLTTSIVIEDGQTVVLGGLMKDSTTGTLTKVPFLGDLPVVGGLFRQRKESSTRKNLLIFITARLLGPRGETT
jgi:type II secretory pathway component GspD/PulD (secretin)